MSLSFEDAEWRAAKRAEEEKILRKAHRYNRELERKRESARRWTAFYLTLLLTGLMLLLTGKARSGESGPGKAEPVVDRPAVVEPAAEPADNYCADIPLDRDTQAKLCAICAETGVPYELALAVIRRESNFQNVTGDGGKSIGYMQIQPCWHQARMERLGVTDLMDPASNFRVGCDYLAELLEQYPLEDALTVYNSGRPGQSDYANSVLKYVGGLPNV